MRTEAEVARDLAKTAVDKWRQQSAKMMSVLPTHILPKNRIDPSVFELHSSFPEVVELQHADMEDQRAREVAMLSTLDAILREMQRLTEKVRQHEEELIRLRSGGSGRPTAMHLILAELERRGAEGMLESTQAEQARVLASWLRKAQTLAAPTKPKTITNNANFRAAYRKLRKPRAR